MNILRYGIPRRIYHYMFSLSNCLTLFDVISLLALRLYIYILTQPLNNTQYNYTTCGVDMLTLYYAQVCRWY